MNWFTNKIVEAESSLKNVLNLSKSNNNNGDHDLEESVGITPSLKEFVQNICEHPNTWLEFPLEKSQESIVLSDWQERHARLMLNQVDELGELRFQLCPSHLKDERFWKIYFLLVQNKIGPISFNEKIPTSPSSKRSKEQNTSSQSIEDYYDEMFQDSINNSMSFDSGIDEKEDNYYEKFSGDLLADLSFEKGKQ